MVLRASSISSSLIMRFEFTVLAQVRLPPGHKHRHNQGKALDGKAVIRWNAVAKDRVAKNSAARHSKNVCLCAVGATSMRVDISKSQPAFIAPHTKTA